MMNKEREHALDMISAAMAIVVQTQDIEMSAEILADAGDKYGRTLVEELLTELCIGDNRGWMGESLAKDILIKRAMLSMIRPLPLTWMKTRN